MTTDILIIVCAAIFCRRSRLWRWSRMQAISMPQAGPRPGRWWSLLPLAAGSCWCMISSRPARLPCSSWTRAPACLPSTLSASIFDSKQLLTHVLYNRLKGQPVKSGSISLEQSSTACVPLLMTAWWRNRTGPPCSVGRPRAQRPADRARARLTTRPSRRRPARPPAALQTTTDTNDRY